MLVLSRQRNETIMIGDDIEITIVDVRGDKVRLGITAPPHIAVHRKEVYDAIRRNRSASRGENGQSSSIESFANRRDKREENPPAGQSNQS